MIPGVCFEVGPVLEEITILPHLHPLCVDNGQLFRIRRTHSSVFLLFIILCLAFHHPSQAPLAETERCSRFLLRADNVSTAGPTFECCFLK